MFSLFQSHQPFLSFRAKSRNLFLLAVAALTPHNNKRFLDCVSLARNSARNDKTEALTQTLIERADLPRLRPEPRDSEHDEDGPDSTRDNGNHGTKKCRR